MTPPAPEVSEPALALDWRADLARSLPRVGLGVLVGGVALWLAFRGVDWQAMLAALRQVDYRWVALSLFSVLLTLLAATARWALLFFPQHRERSWWVLCGGLLVGQMLNIVVPARLGEVARVYVVGTNERVSKTRVLATIVVEKVLDLGAFALSLIVLLVGMSLPPWIRGSGDALLVGSGLALALMFVFSRWGHLGLRALQALGRRLPGLWGDRLALYGRLALEGLSALRHGGAHLGLWALSSSVVVFGACTNYLLFRALGLALPPIAALFLLVVLQVGNAPPSLPGKLGVFHYLTVLALSIFGVERSVALSYALVLYAVAYLSKIVLGGLALSFYRRRSSAFVRPVSSLD